MLNSQLEQDQVLFGDLRNLKKLREIQNLSADDLRLHAATLRRLLVDEELVKAAVRRRLPLFFYPVDSKPLVRAARNSRVLCFCLWGVTVFDTRFSGAVMSEGTLYAGEEFNPDSQVQLKLASFMNQSVAMSPPLPKQSIPGMLLTRREIIRYISNKIGEVHFDPKPSGELNPEKMFALGRLRRVYQVGLREGVPAVSFNPQVFDEEKSSVFRYQPDQIDAVYLEFLTTVELLLTSPEVQSLEIAIAKDLGVEPDLFN